MLDSDGDGDEDDGGAAAAAARRGGGGAAKRARRGGDALGPGELRALLRELREGRRALEGSADKALVTADRALALNRTLVDDAQVAAGTMSIQLHAFHAGFAITDSQGQS